MSERCRSCKAPIRWAISERGNFMILDLDPSPAGTIRLAAADRRGGTPRAVVVPAERRAELVGELYLDHHATCPHASQHRRRRSP
jgi:hypothetical protein